MEFVVLGVLLFVAAVIAVDTVRQRRILPRARSTSGAPSPVGWPARNAIVPRRRHALAREQATPVDVYRVIGDTLGWPASSPACQDGAEVRIFRLRWGNDYAIVPSRP